MEAGGMNPLPPRDFFLAKRDAFLVPEQRGYVVEHGECNPGFMRSLHYEVERLFHDVRPRVIWEPFAGHTVNRTIDECSFDGDLKLILYDIEPNDERVKKVDSTIECPDEEVHGVFIHPPYFGTYPMSSSDGELSLNENPNVYMLKMMCHANLVMKCLVETGLVCVVARPVNIPFSNKVFHLDWHLVKLFLDKGFSIMRVLQSSPDFCFILRRK
jgi:hypothetical protein